MKKILIYIVLGYSLIHLASCTNNDSVSDFNLICEYFDSLEQVGFEGNNSDPDYKFKFINDRINESIPLDHVATLIWDATLGMVPEDRYLFFKDATEEELKKTWQCDSMERLLKNFEIQ